LIDLVQGKKSGSLGVLDVPVSQAVNREGLQEVARLLASGYVRLLTSRSRPAHGTFPQNSLASPGEKSDELAARTTGERARCKRV
jgi:hypothetical protein